MEGKKPELKLKKGGVNGGEWVGRGKTADAETMRLGGQEHSLRRGKEGREDAHLPVLACPLPCELALV